MFVWSACGPSKAKKTLKNYASHFDFDLCHFLTLFFYKEKLLMSSGHLKYEFLTHFLTGLCL